MENKTKSILKLFIGYCVLLAVLTILYNELPIIVNYSLFGTDEFYSGLIINLYSSAVDFLFFSIILFIILGRHEKNDKIVQYKENIDDCRFWFSDEAAFKIAGNIRRLQELKCREFDLSKTTLTNTKLKKMAFDNSKFMGACLDKINLDFCEINNTDFHGASIKYSSLNNIKITNSQMKSIKLVKSKMMSSTIKNTLFQLADLSSTNFHATVFIDCDFKSAILDGCNFERADLRKVINLTAEQLLKCSSLKYAKLSEDLKSQIDMQDPMAINLRGKNKPRLKCTP